MSVFPVDKKIATEYLTKLVSINSVNPDLVPGAAGEGEIAKYLELVCRDLGLEVELQETAPGRPNVIAKWPGSGSAPSLLLTGHVDVVSVEGMQHPPFEPKIENGNLFGRGSFDMKGGVAAILGATHALRTSDFQPKGDLYLAFVTDEEYKSLGTEAFVKKIRPDAAILTEPTGLDICIAHKGFAWLTLTTHGKAAHGSLSESGVDAIVNMGKLLKYLEKLESEFLHEFTHSLLTRPSVHASLVSGGLGISTYPDKCELTIEHRLLPGQSDEDVLNLWRAEIARLAIEDSRFQADVNLDFWRPGFEIDRNTPIVQALANSYQKILDKEPIYVGTAGWLDSALLMEAGIPTVIIGPSGEGAHAAIEYVDLESVFRCAEILAATAAHWLRS